MREATSSRSPMAARSARPSPSRSSSIPTSRWHSHATISPSRASITSRDPKAKPGASPPSTCRRFRTRAVGSSSRPAMVHSAPPVAAVHARTRMEPRMMLKASRFLLVMLVCTVAFAGRPARADSTPEALVEKARLTFESLYNDKDYTQLRKNMKLAKAVLIIPSELKGAFIVGAGGSGVLVAKDENGAWGYPAFYTVGSGSLGFQIGFQNSEAVFVIMTE